MGLALLIPFALQGLLMGVDEFYFHRQRGLGVWERRGHPLDSFTLLACFLWLGFAPLTSESRVVYLMLAVFSCLFITKDEFVHAENCRPGEHWLHAMLFILHPIVLGAAAILRWAPGFGELMPLFWGQTVFVGAYLLYQLVYWNLLYDEKSEFHSTPIVARKSLGPQE